jgi:hypothetical protein
MRQKHIGGAIYRSAKLSVSKLAAVGFGDQKCFVGRGCDALIK